MNEKMERELALTRDLISLEAGDAVGLASRVDVIIKSLSDVCETALSDVAGRIANFRDFNSTQRELLMIVDRHNYADTAKIVIAKPTGLKVTYLELIHSYLIPGIDYCAEVSGHLDGFTSFIGRIVNNRQDRIALNDMYAGTSILTEDRYVEMTSINAVRQTCYVTGGTESEAKLETLVESNSQWRDVIFSLNEVEEGLKKLSPKAMEQKVNKAVNYLKTLRSASGRGDMAETSPEMLMRLADYIEATARSVELYSVVYHDAIGFSEAFKEATKKLKMILNEK